jgi:hypothetical protein
MSWCVGRGMGGGGRGNLIKQKIYTALITNIVGIQLRGGLYRQYSYQDC